MCMHCGKISSILSSDKPSLRCKHTMEGTTVGNMDPDPPEFQVLRRFSILLCCRMSRDQRTKANWALLQACEVAEKTSSPVAVVFNLVKP